MATATAAARACPSRDDGVAETVVLRFAIYLAIYRVSVIKGRAFMAEPRRRRGGDETTAWWRRDDGMVVTTAWPRQRHGRDKSNGMAETTAWPRRHDGVVVMVAMVAYCCSVPRCHLLHYILTSLLCYSVLQV
jgi:hypothetical protein